MNKQGIWPASVTAIALVLAGCTGVQVTEPPQAEPPATEPPTVESPTSAADSTKVPPAATSAQPPPPRAEPAFQVRTGAFVSGEHPTTGTAQILEQDGKAIVEFGGDFQTRNGPDLVVVLHRFADVLGSTTPPDYPLQAGDYVVLGALKSTTGAQTYAVPEGINVAEYPSIAIWCQTFNATFGSAMLNNAVS